jgi:ABC-type sugar transport system ATPase subunit
VTSDGASAVSLDRTDGGHGSTVPAIACSDVVKHYGQTQALKGVSVVVRPGTIHALIGENGAGKSTLVGILAGKVAATSGDVRIYDTPLGEGDPRAARAAGVVAIYQELMIAPAMSAVENVFIGQEMSRSGFTNEAGMRSRFMELCARLQVSIDPSSRAGDLSVADQQQLEIMRAVNTNARVMLFDEPTAALAQSERDALFRLIRALAADGVTIVYISHNLAEVRELSDEITVFRDGQVVASRPKSTWTERAMVDAMLGAEVAAERREEDHRAPKRSEAPRLEVSGVEVPGRLRRAAFAVHPGEIVGIAGLVGAGRTTLLRALAGAEPTSTGEMLLDGEPVRWPRNPREALKRGIAMIPESRKDDGLVLGMRGADNIALAHLGGLTKAGWISERALKRQARELAQQVGLDPERVEAPASALSGGNQQKLLLARWMMRRPRVLLADEPTRGIDVGAKQEVMNVLRSFASEGTSIIIVSSELEEIEAISDRVIVLWQGQTVKELDRERGEVNVPTMVHAAFGLDRREP